MPPTERRSNEEGYFARIEIEKKRELALQQQQEMEAQQRAELKQLHWMRCPKCGMELQTLHRGEVEIDTCFHCQGVWLDAGELEQILAAGSEESGGMLKAVTSLFKGR